MKMLGSILGIFLVLQTQISFANNQLAELQQTNSNHQTNSAYLLVDFHWNNNIP